VKIPGVKASVSISYDDRQVPHVFAENDHDMYLTQGYVTAKDRLWQMDFTSYASAGRLSELLGEGYLEYDRLQRRIGMLSSAIKTLNVIEKNPETKRAMDAYTQGVNAYIKTLSYEDYPFEYKLMDYKPEPWTNLKSVLIMKYVSAMLTGYEEDISMAHMLAALGKTEFQKLYPEYASMDLEQMNVLKKLDIENLPYADHINYEFLTNRSQVTPSSFNPKLGSNNWAVSSSKSETGNPILCNDPHLNLSLPSIWYEVQLSSNSTNVYGVSIPGTIGVIIGFNEKIAWGVTNGSTDVRDWYKPKIKSDYSAYEMDGKWLKMDMSIEEIKVKDQASFFDTIYSTIHGPIVIDNSFDVTPDAKNFALKWTLHEPTNEFLAFIHLNKAKNYGDFKESISHYKCPIQNFIFASSSDTIAIHHQGMLYEKWNGQGRFLLDGTKRSHLYDKVVLDSQLPQAFNPESGFLYSANNFPTYDSIDTYMNGYYSEPRAHRIKYILSSKEKLSIADMKKMQLDNVNEVARLVLPDLIEVLDKSKNNSAKSKKVIQLLNDWDCNYDKKSQAAYFYDELWNNITQLTWDELQIQDYYLRDPDVSVLLKMIKYEKTSKYFDKLNTDKKEGLSDIILEAFKITLKSSDFEQWGEFHKVDVIHLSKIEALGDYSTSLSGHPNALNAISQNWGPSWRMIVDMGERPKAYGIYAGGQSGNPGSKHYDDFIKDWKKGKYYELLFFLDKKEAKLNCKSHFTISK
jgi:penicillin amidase